MAEKKERRKKKEGRKMAKSKFSNVIFSTVLKVSGAFRVDLNITIANGSSLYSF